MLEVTHLRKPVSVKEKLAVVLCDLATGETTENLMFQFRLHMDIISQFTESVCKAIHDTLVPGYMKMPLVRKNGIT